MIPEDLVALFGSAGLPGYVLPGLLMVLGLFGGAVVALGLRRRRDTGVIIGVFFALSALHLGDRYTTLSLAMFGAAVLGGLGTGLVATVGRTPARFWRRPQHRLE